jgi:hypothetical protein
MPRFAKPPVRGNEKLAWGALWLINAGIWMITLAVFVPGSAWPTLLGRLAETAGVILFALHAWPRVKAT